MEQLQQETKEQTFEREIGAVYDFFVRAERSGEQFSYKKIGEVYPHDMSTVRKCVRNYWSWFLIKQDGARPFTFSCHGLVGYPRQYFIDAHKPNQGRYFYHFAVALQEAAIRAEEERQKRGEMKMQTQQQPLPGVDKEEGAASTPVPDQDPPEHVHIERIEDEAEGNGERSSNGSLSAGASPMTFPVVGGANPGVPSGEAPQLSQESNPPSPERGQLKSTMGVGRFMLVATACLAVLVGLGIWWLVSRR
jgi:hypothetical protein